MAKVKLSDFKKYFATLSTEELHKEITTLLKFDQVQAFYTQGKISEAEEEKMLEACKQKIYKTFWTPKDNPRNNISNVKIREINTFEKSGATPSAVIQLILHRVEVATIFADSFGGMSEGNYNVSSNAFDKALKLMDKHELFGEFKADCKAIFSYDNLDYSYIDNMRESFDDLKKRQI